ncbi:hypothetical protein PA598K_04592 [Paenibacillus sp. 598K]|nr:hypothetical protein PA598K_04592 [Paenibacillus sp. 598K]
MDKYSKSALNAVRYMQSNRTESPVEAWYIATGEQFGEGSWGQAKGCPRTAFLGICEEGLVKGVKPGRYNKRPHSLNKQYALHAIALFKQDASNIQRSNKELWSLVTRGKNIQSNYQVEMVKALWAENLIV